MNMKKASLIGCFLAFLSVGACASVKDYGQTSVLDQGRLDRIVVGKSTMADVRRILGNPLKIQHYSKGVPIKELWLYDARRYHTSLGFATDAVEEDVSVMFNWHNVVTDVKKTKSNPLDDSNGTGGM